MKKSNYDKKIINFTPGPSGTNGYIQLFYEATYPCVITGFVINGSATSQWPPNSGTLVPFQWYISLVKDGQNVPSVYFNSGSSPSITPEEHVILFDSGVVSSNVNSICECKTKTSRKLMSGDRLYFSFDLGTLDANFCYTLQFFIKT